MQIFRLRQRGFGVVSQQWGNLQRYPTIHAAGPIVDRTEEVGRLGKILQRQFEEKSLPGFAFL